MTRSPRRDLPTPAPTPSQVSASPTTSRRSVLRGAAAAGAVGAFAAPLAACAGSSASAGPSGPPTGAGSGKPSGPITKASEVPIGGGRVATVSGTKVVVTQPEKGTFKAFTAVCPHKGCTVNEISDDVIHCPCHGSEFDATNGSVLKGPAAAPLASVPIAVQDGTVSFA